MLRDYKTIQERRTYIEKKRNMELPAISVYPEGLEVAQFKNCENMIGAVQVPVGVAGPLKISGTYAKGEYYIPLATTEGALVASVARGCKAISQGDSVRVFTENAGMTRGCVFKTKGIPEGKKLETWLDKNTAVLSRVAQKTSSHISLEQIFTRVVGKSTFMRFSFDTQDAMGMNMVTIATEQITRFVEKETGNTCVTIAGNFDVDKKPSWLNSILGRGRQVWAEARIPREVVAEVLKTTPEKIDSIAKEKCLVGSAISGSLGQNAHFANMIAALFLACGQDIAHTVEGSLGITVTEVIDTGLYISIHLPDLPIGTVGGGTGLPSQKEMLILLDCFGGDGGKNAAKLAELTGATVLAGELSLLAALSVGSLASSHQRFARGRK